MLRKLIMLVCLICGTNAIAQTAGKGSATTKTTQNQVDPKIDYKQMGAPLPPFILLSFHDTSVKKDATIALTPAEPMTAREKRKARKNKEAAEQTTTGPKIKTEKDFDNGANLFVMMFNPTCSHCTDETQILEKNIASFKKSKIVLMANTPMRPYLQDFVKNYHTDDYPAISVGMDSAGFMNNVFLYQALPQISIYNGDRKLIKTYTGEVAIDSLMKYIQ